MRTPLPILALALAGCTRGAPPEPAPVAAQLEVPEPVARGPRAIPLDRVRRIPEGGVLVRVLDPGEAPLALLRLSPQVGELARVHTVLDLGIAMGLGGQLVPQAPLPPMIMELEIEVMGVSPEGDIQYSVELVDAALGEAPDTPPQVSESLLADLTAMVGLRGERTVSASGRLIAESYPPPEGSSEQTAAHLDTLSSALAQMTLPLPEEPVGLGATWESLSRGQTGEVALARRSTIALTARDGDRLTLETEIDQEPLSWTLELPKAPGVVADITQFESSGGAQSELILSQLVPPRTHSQISTSLQTSLHLDAIEQQIDQHIDIDLSTERR